MSNETAEKLMEEITILQPSKEWPPVLANDEKVKFEGQFSLSEWARTNIAVVAVLLGFILFSVRLLGHSLSTESLVYIFCLGALGLAFTYFMYRKQKWLITNRAIYQNNGRPMLLSSARKVGGVGSTIRASGRWGVGISLIGVTNARSVRTFLQGRQT